MNWIARALQGRIWAPAALAAWFGTWAAATFPISSSLCALAALSWGGLAVLCGRAGRTLLAPAAAWLTLVLLVACLAATSASKAPQSSPDPPVRGRTPPLQVLRVSSSALPREAGAVFEAAWLATCALNGPLRGQCDRRSGALRVRWQGQLSPPRVGDLLRVPAFVAPPPGYRNPGADSLRRVWQRRGLVGRVVVRAMQSRVEVPTGGGLASPWRRWRRSAAAVRTAIAAALARSNPGRPGAIIRALGVGDRGGIDPDLRRMLRDSGTAHILAVSGAHVSLLVALVAGLLGLAIRWLVPRLLRRFTTWQLVAPASVLAAWGYVALTGAAASTIRAAAMVTIALTLRAAAMRLDLLEALGLAALLIVLVAPDAVHDVGLQLSILGVVGVHAGAAIAAGSRAEDGRRLRVLEAFGASTGAALTTALVALPTFGQLPLLAPWANLMIVPLVGLAVLPLSLAAVCVAGVSALAGGEACAAALELLHWVVSWAIVPIDAAVAAPHWLWCTWRPGASAATAFVFLLPAAVLLLWSMRRRPMSAVISLTLLLALPLGLIRGAAGPPAGEFEAWFFDVGHGDATLLRLPGGLIVMVDGGGEVGDDGRVGERALLPALRNLGVDRIDIMVLTHPHPDHENGLLALARALPVRELWWNGEHAAGQEHLKLLATLRQQGTKWRSWRAQDGAADCRQMAVGGVQIKVVWPPEPVMEPAPAGHANDRSLVLEVGVGAQRLLLSGDIERPAERALLSGRLLAPHIAILKVPHHGSLTSSSPPLLRHLAPLLAIAGARSWGQLPFPHPEIRRRYTEHGIGLWSTEAGAVHVQVRADGWCATQATRSVCSAAPPERRRRPLRTQAKANSNIVANDTALPVASPGAR